jgi:hypothetical protein
LPKLDGRLVPRIPKQEVEVGRHQGRRLRAALLERDDAKEVVRAEHFVKQLADVVKVLVADLDEDRAGIG